MSRLAFVPKVFGSAIVLLLLSVALAKADSNTFSVGCLSNDWVLQAAEGIQPLQAPARVTVSPAVMWPPTNAFRRMTIRMSLATGSTKLTIPVDVGLAVSSVTHDQVVQDDATDVACGTKAGENVETDWRPKDFRRLRAHGRLRSANDVVSLRGIRLRKELCTKVGPRTYQISIRCCDNTNLVCDSRPELLNVLVSPDAPPPATVRHYEYVFPDGNIYVYDIDNGFNLIKQISVPTLVGVRGSVASAATGVLYLSYGTDAGSGGSMLAYDLRSDTVLWQQTYPFGIDSMSITPDGKRIYMPVGELAPVGIWQVLNAANGAVIGSIDTEGAGPHNTLISKNGAHVYMGPRASNYLVKATTSPNAVSQKIGPVLDGVRPFTINASETLAFITTSRFLGLQVADVGSGKIIYTTQVVGFPTSGGVGSAFSHGISLSPNGTELYLIDSISSYVHVFDVSGVPSMPPKQVADIPLVGPLSGDEVGCAYDCLRDGWLHHSRDGRYVFVGDSGDVIDTTLRKSVATLPAMANSRKEIEIDFQDDVPVWAMNNRSSIPN